MWSIVRIRVYQPISLQRCPIPQPVVEFINSSQCSPEQSRPWAHKGGCLHFWGLNLQEVHTHTYHTSSEIHQPLKFMKHLGCPGLAYGFDCIWLNAFFALPANATRYFSQGSFLCGIRWSSQFLGLYRARANQCVSFKSNFVCK